ncbi:MAG: hypothetical protein JO311_07005 [Candidatus Eremiobacteraeota bacterium]|nr:hypothetical protein [Candidatus Eremiobacteraeota bacterium]
MIARYIAVGACATVCALLWTGCGGKNAIPASVSPGLGPQGNGAAAARLTARFMVPHMRAAGCGNSVVYVTSYNNTVYVYDQRHSHKTPCGQITGLVNPQGLFVDKQRNLWVAVFGDCKAQLSSVFEFAPGGSTPIKTLQDPAGAASDVAVDNVSGTVYVANFFNYTNGCASGNNGVVEVYAGGSTTPTGTLSDPNMNYAFDDAVDQQGNVYVTFLKLNGPTGVGQIDEWIGGAGSPNNLGITLQAPGGIQTTKTGALLVCDQSVACGDFEPGSTTMTHLFATQHPGSFGVALDRREEHAWVENPALGAHDLKQFVYPGPDKRPQKAFTVTGGGYAGVALSPPAPQGKPY